MTPRADPDDDRTEPVTGAATPGDGAAPADPGRRRFGKGIAATAPVLLTLYGRPLFAGANCTPSGWVSGNTSLHHTALDCGGKTPGYWARPESKDDEPGWQRSHERALDDPDFGFPGPAYTVSGVPATPQQAVEDPRETPFDGVDPATRELVHFGVAALLNARYQPGYRLSQSQVVKMVYAAINSGEYVTPSGDVLTARQVHYFLENTMNVPGWGPGSMG